VEMPTAPNLPVDTGEFCANPHCNRIVEGDGTSVRAPGGELICMKCFRETRWMIKQDENAEMRRIWRK